MGLQHSAALKPLPPPNLPENGRDFVRPLRPRSAGFQELLQIVEGAGPGPSRAVGIGPGLESRVIDEQTRFSALILKKHLDLGRRRIAFALKRKPQVLVLPNPGEAEAFSAFHFDARPLGNFALEGRAEPFAPALHVFPSAKRGVDGDPKRFRRTDEIAFEQPILLGDAPLPFVFDGDRRAPPVLLGPFINKLNRRPSTLGKGIFCIQVLIPLCERLARSNLAGFIRNGEIGRERVIHRRSNPTQAQDSATLRVKPEAQDPARDRKNTSPYSTSESEARHAKIECEAAMKQYALGLDYGTNSVRALLVDCHDGTEIGVSVVNFPSGESGVLLDPNDPLLARQNPADYLTCTPQAVRGAIDDAQSRGLGFAADQVVGIGVDTTASSPLPLDDRCQPLALSERFQGNLAAQCWLWKDHTAHEEAEEISENARALGRPYLAKCGGAYSSEWFWAKALKSLRTAPDVFRAARTWAECQDFIPAWLCGIQDPAEMKRGICAAGHKAMFHDSWGGLPDEEFLAGLDPALASIRPRLFQRTHTSDQLAGILDPGIASKMGLPAGIPVAVGAIDAHLGGVGAGVRPGRLVKIMGTSTCDIMVGDASTPDILGVSGIVPGSVIPGFQGIEAGQAAVGDLFGWFASKVTGRAHHELEAESAALPAGGSGLLALDWNNGSRNVLLDPRVSGLFVGQTLHTTAAEMYRSLLEATAFGARKIIERIAEYGVKIDEIVVCGGIAEKSPLTMQIYADVCNRPMKLSRSAQTCALGAAVMGSVVGRAHADVPTAIDAMTRVQALQYVPNPASIAAYDRLYELYSDLHDAFGRTERTPDLHRLMKELIAIREQARAR